MEINVTTVVKYNQISDQLLKEVKQFLPKKGQTIYFESVRPKARGTTVLPYDRIWDPYKGSSGEFVDIAYVTGNAPGKGETIGRIQFNKMGGGRLPITAGNRDHENKFIYMYLCNFRSENATDPRTKQQAPWYVAAEGRQPVFKLPSAKLTADQKLDIDRVIRRAKDLIDEMGENELRRFAVGLDMKGINLHSDPNEIRVQLFKIAESGEGRGAEKIKQLHKDTNLNANILIKEAEKAQVITYNGALQVWEWTDGGDQICVVSDGRKPIDALITYLLSTKGTVVAEHIEQLTEAKKNPVTKAVGTTHPPVPVADPFTSTPNPKDDPRRRGGRKPGVKNHPK